MSLSSCSYDLLRTGDRNSRILDVIPVPSGGYNVSYLKTVVAEAKVYVRPLQRSLSCEPYCQLDDTVSMFMLLDMM